MTDPRTRWHARLCAWSYRLGSQLFADALCILGFNSLLGTVDVISVWGRLLTMLSFS